MQRALFLRITLLFILVVVLQVPIAAIESTISDRQMTREGAINEVTSTWGGRQQVAGPVLSVPYLDHWVDEKNVEQTVTRRAYFLPKAVRIKGDVKTEVRHRGIFDVPLYQTALEIEGEMPQPDFSEWPIPARDVLWDGAMLVVGIADPKAIREQISLEWNAKQLAFGPGQDGVEFFRGGIHTKIAGLKHGQAGDSYQFRLSMVLGGAGDLQFLPFGTNTDVSLRSPWPDPSFAGAYLPSERTVTPNGFDARWHVLHLARNYPEKWRTNEVAQGVLDASSFGVSFFSPVDAYTATTRSVKYQILFVGLTFLVFFLVEVFRRVKIHPVQYLLVGSALCVFYLLLLALSEHVGFEVAYALGSVAVIGVVSGYCLSILKQQKLAGFVAALLSGLYAFLFVLLQIQDYALLVGALGTLAVVSAVMFVTRKIDWYRIGQAEAA